MTACAPLTLIDTMAAKDAGSRLAVGDIACGADPRQRLDVYVPEKAATPAPVIVFIYGGSWNGGSKSDYSFAGRALAARGYVTIVPDYRLVPAVRFPAFLDDTAGAVRWAHDHAAACGGDTGRVSLVGHSAGAYNAVMVGLDPRYLRRAGLGRGILRSVAALSGPYDFLPLDVDATRNAFGQAGDLRQTQPIPFAAAAAPPMFLATGDADDTVYPRNTHALAAALRKEGAVVEEKTYPGIGHPGILLALTTALRGRAPCSTTSTPSSGGTETIRPGRVCTAVRAPMSNEQARVRQQRRTSSPGGMDAWPAV